MKKTYTKPLISVEAMLLDTSIANITCDMNKNEVLDLKEFGFFMAGKNCEHNLLETGGFDFNNDGESDIHDTVCYHTNIQKAFLS